jgi:hypothetical protein
MQEHNQSPPILELAARHSMFLIIHNMCTVFIRKYFRLLLCNQFGNETLFCLKQLYFVNLVVFIHPMCVMCTSFKKLLDIFYYYNFAKSSPPWRGGLSSAPLWDTLTNCFYPRQMFFFISILVYIYVILL